MAQTITVTLEDDLDGGPADQTVRFGLDGAEIHEVADGISKEAADLAAPIMWRGEEGRAPGRQCCVGCAAVSNPQRHGVTDQIRVSWRLKGDPGLVRGRASCAHQ